MTAESIFVDTNILVYAHDQAAGEKHHRARERVLELWDHETPPSISVQVLQELYVNLEKKKIPLATIHSIIEDYLQWHVIDNDAAVLRNGLRIKQRWRLSLWDALIVSAAQQAHAQNLWSEDLQTGQNIEGLRIINPLLATG